MAKFCPLFSGSTGNSIFIENKNSAVLIDAGISAKQITTALAEREFDISEIGGIFITHEHSDHTKGIRVFCSKNHIPVYLTEGTYNGMKAKNEIFDTVDYRVITPETDMGDIGIRYFHTSHDALESCGYIIEAGNRKIAVCTDLGCVSDEVHNSLEGCDLVLIESNHDIKMLQNNPKYTFPLKRRILSDRGHLSNNACAEEVLKLALGGTTRFVLGHLSKENNIPPLAKQTTAALLNMNGLVENTDYQLCVAKPCENDVIIL